MPEDNLPKSVTQAVELIRASEFKPMDDLDMALFAGVQMEKETTIAYYSDNLVIIKEGEDYIFISQGDETEEGKPPEMVERRLKLG